tara:strand:+ start:212 stop:382 length:171 start_codon:yes stop_codon:yes gene_type:complete
MDHSREIYAMTRRANKIGLHQEPPTLRMDCWHEGEQPPERKPWQLQIMIEKKRPLM